MVTEGQPVAPAQHPPRIVLSWRIPAAVPVLLAMAAAAALALHHLTGLSIWLDEAISIAAARLDWTDPWGAVTGHGNTALYMPLYYAVLSAWLAVGESEAWVRALSVVFAVLAIPVVYALGRQLLGPRVGTAAALLVAVNGFLVEFARSPRSYSLVVLLAAASTLLFVRALEAPSRRRWILYGLVSGAGVYASYSISVLFVAHLLVLPLAPRWRARWRAAVAGHAVLAIVAAPMLLAIATLSVPGLDWIRRPDPAALIEAWRNLSGHRTWQAGAYLAALAVTAALAVRARGQDRDRAWRLALPVAMTVVPIVGLFAVSQVRPLFQDRYLIAVVPAMALLGAAALEAVRPRALAAGALAAFVLLSGSSAWLNAGWDFYYREDWRAATAFVLDGARPGDTVVLYIPDGRMPYDYYVRLAGDRDDAPRVVYPERETAPFSRDGSESRELYRLDLQHAVRTSASAARVWVVLRIDHEEDRPLVLAPFERCRDELAREAFENLVVHLFDRPTPACAGGA